MVAPSAVRPLGPSLATGLALSALVLGCTPIQEAEHPDAPDRQSVRLRLAAGAERSPAFPRNLRLLTCVREAERHDFGEDQDITLSPGPLCVDVKIVDPKPHEQTLCFLARGGHLYEVDATAEANGRTLVWVTEHPNFREMP